MSQNQKALFIIFGGTGDLAYRKLYPALYKLYSKNFLNENFAVIGTARRPWTDEYYQEVVYNSVKDIQSSEADAKEFASHFYYLSHNVNDTENYQELLQLANELDGKYNIEGNRIFYFSVSPSFFGTISSHLKAEKLLSTTGFNRVIIEKPFGTNYDDSNSLNNEILESFTEEQIYRIDHYLGKEMIQQLQVLRFANPLVRKIWNKDFISNMQVTLAEDIGVETRGAYYEQSGALRDMVQNHVLQIVSILFMDEPSEFNSGEIIKNKVKALEELIPITDETVNEKIIRGQYTTPADNSDIPAYLAENEVAADSVVETFVAAQIESTNKNWTGVPIYVRTGKRMKDKNTQIDIVFKNNLNPLFGHATEQENVFTLCIGPNEGYTLQLNNKKSGHDIETQPFTLYHKQTGEAPDDYERLILSTLYGEKTNFVHWREVAASWKYIDAIRAAWAKDESSLQLYPAFTNGPEAATELLEKNNHYWIW